MIGGKFDSEFAAFLRTLKQKNDIVEVIRSYVAVDRKGGNYWACCPFHHEKTPSFSVSEYEGFYHCFGCGESGDVISFLRKYEDLSYIEAVRVLAENAGMEMPQFSNDEKYIKAKREKERSLQILNLTREFYKQNLFKPEATLAQEYLKKRRLTRTALNDFELGVSLNSADLPMFLRSKGYSNDEMVKAGVCDISKKGLPYDFIFDRLAFPIVNTQGDCIGFSGRDLDNSDMMKYKNTSTTKLFDKSKI